MATIEQIKEALQKVKYPGMSRDIVSFGMVKDVVVNGADVVLTLEMKSNDEKIEDEICNAAKEAIQAMGGVEKLELRTSRPAASGGSHAGHNHGAQGGARPAGLGADPWAGRKPIRGVQNIIAVASGKGGVGKSTVATNLAVGLAKKGRKVGLLDSDIYGPSVHMMFGAMDLRPTSYDGKTLEPFLKHGVKFMSIGLLLGEGTPVIWRGPMVMKMIDQFLNDVNWGELDDLVIDLPPGTGDAQLTLVQKVPITGAVIVTTPQNVALMDAVRGLEMFKRVDVPAIGLVENMSFFTCAKCGTEAHIFSHGGGAKTATELGIPLLTEVPLQPSVREGGDEGMPVILGQPDSAPAKAFGVLVDKVIDFVDKAPKPQASAPTPKLNIVQG
jgi:ATP-binding protein involved in chromosome partitioning